jgi:hypothetical protein
MTINMKNIHAISALRSNRLAHGFLLSVCSFLLSLDVSAANVSYANATVNLVEIRSDAWGAWLIISLKDSAGNNILKLCDTAQNQSAIAISLLDSAAKGVEAIALMAKASGKTVAGWGIDTSAQTAWCGLGNFALQPS